jgi:hypothetical protein
VMDSSDHLGTVGSSRRFKDNIKPMGQTSASLLTFLRLKATSRQRSLTRCRRS